MARKNFKKFREKDRIGKYSYQKDIDYRDELYQKEYKSNESFETLYLADPTPTEECCSCCYHDWLPCSVCQKRNAIERDKRIKKIAYSKRLESSIVKNLKIRDEDFWIRLRLHSKYPKVYLDYNPHDPYTNFDKISPMPLVFLAANALNTYICNSIYTGNFKINKYLAQLSLDIKGILFGGNPTDIKLNSVCWFTLSDHTYQIYILDNDRNPIGFYLVDQAYHLADNKQDIEKDIIHNRLTDLMKNTIMQSISRLKVRRISSKISEYNQELWSK